MSDQSNREQTSVSRYKLTHPALRKNLMFRWHAFM